MFIVSYIKFEDSFGIFVKVEIFLNDAKNKKASLLEIK
jgi:hypothetical protein